MAISTQFSPDIYTTSSVQYGSRQKLTKAFMSLQNISKSEFADVVLNSKQPVLVDFYATWCGPCKQIAVALEEMSKTHPNVKIVKVDVDAQSDLAMEYNISSIPTLILFADGSPAKQVVGAVSRTEIEKLFT